MLKPTVPLLFFASFASDLCAQQFTHTCQFNQGPLKGQSRAFSNAQPAMVGAPCQDGAGSTGVVVSDGAGRPPAEGARRPPAGGGRQPVEARDHEARTSPVTAVADVPTGRAWLVGNQPEPSGYGLYSYMLFGSLPSDATRPLYAAVIKASLSKIESIESQLQTFPPVQLNLYLMPVFSGPPKYAQPDDLANWIIDEDHYNYPRARQILDSLPDKRNGVYILSVLSRPIDSSHQLKPPYLLQDLSNVEPGIVVAWIQYFLNQAAKGKPWEENMGDKLALDLRNDIEQVAVQMQLTLPAMAAAIKWFKPGSE